MEALRALKRHLARTVWQALRASTTEAPIPTHPDQHVPNLQPAGVPALT